MGVLILKNHINNILDYAQILKNNFKLNITKFSLKKLIYKIKKIA